MEKVIVTGANGFIGKTLVNALLAKGYQVTALDVRFDDVLAKDERITCVNVMNKEVAALMQEIPQAEYKCFFHLAWVGTSGSARADYNVQLNNVKLTCDYIKLCSEIGCKRVVYASSINEMETYEYLQSDDIEPAATFTAPESWQPISWARLLPSLTASSSSQLSSPISTAWARSLPE